ncbi:hypothetical protein JNUCC0626_19895 [Lentzea sp. JNUCC 0626]|uniref:hypothetical protein n=1 Tax=Lentzea sp. JNUCC 0626 TaxID=3367513 RepID=UPI00374A6E33
MLFLALILMAGSTLCIVLGLVLDGMAWLLVLGTLVAIAAAVAAVIGDRRHDY